MQTPPLLVIPPIGIGWSRDLEYEVVAKTFTSSLLRSLFSGRIAVFRNQKMPLFKVERSAVDDVFVAAALEEKSGTAKRRAIREAIFDVGSQLKFDPRQWVVVADAASLAMRNIDHLLPPDVPGPYAHSEVEFYWAKAGKDEVSNHSATPGLWAVRGALLPFVLERWKEAWREDGEGGMCNEEKVWTRVVQELPLRKRAFEKGEVVAPRIGAVDWEAVSNAAFVTVPDWPEKEAWKFLQALYFGTYLGDETGMMVNILEA